ncbi:MAG: hypothetical protein IT285_13105 [Bdellovibrionales bacterium]|nr:hypothetical protein [Bdellovibrionales bacterium]
MFEGGARVRWTTSTEPAGVRWELQGRAPGESAYVRVAVQTSVGAGAQELRHWAPAGSHAYRLAALRPDGTTAALSESILETGLPTAQIAGLTLSIQSESVVAMAVTTAENGVDRWLLEVRINGVGPWLRIGESRSQGSGDRLKFVHALPGDGTHAYRLQALFLNGTRVDVANDSLTLQSAPVVITGFTLSVASATVNIRWTSVKETTLQGYLVQVQLNGVGSWSNVKGEVARGAGSAYSVNSVPGSGQHNYRIMAVLVGGSQLFLVQGTTLV